MKKKIFSLCFSLVVLLSTPTFAQGPGEPYFPETANGAQNASYLNQSLRWQNPIGTTYNEIFISYDSLKVANMDPSALYISGYPSTAYDSIRINQQLYYPTRYFWCVVEYNSSDFTKGEVWHFTTTIDYIDFCLLDDFSFGLGKWNINNVGGCGWQIGESPNYTLPIPSTSKLLRADKNLCGTNINATATFQQVNIMNHMYAGRLEFDSDWKTEYPNDLAKVEMTSNNGVTWTTLWEKVGISDRNKHIMLTLFSGNTGTIQTVQVRFKTTQYTSDSWWAIDNVRIIGEDGILTHIHPYITNVRTDYSAQPQVVIKFGLILPSPNVTIERKDGIPLSNNNYQIIANLTVFYNATFIDSTISDSTIYTYRIGNEEWNNWRVYSNEGTAYVFPTIPVELQSFTAEIIGSDVQLFWSTSTETNNSGFEILRSTQNDNNGWESSGFVPGFGTTTEVHNYSFVDEGLQSGNYQYRLKQIDFNGTFDYSNSIEVTIDAPTMFSLEQNYPNPFNPTTKIKFTIPMNPPSSPFTKGGNGDSRGGFVTLKVYDVLGNEVATLVNEEKPAGTYEIDFIVGQDSSPDLSSGVYFYQLKAGSFVETKKMILLK